MNKLFYFYYNKILKESFFILLIKILTNKKQLFNITKYLTK